MESQQIHIHALVLMTISDHYTRAMFTSPKDKQNKARAIGLLFGEQHGTSVEVHNSIEIYDNDGVVS